MLGVCLLKFSILEIFNGRFLVKVQDKNHVWTVRSFGSGCTSFQTKLGSRCHVLIGTPDSYVRSKTYRMNRKVTRLTGYNAKEKLIKRCDKLLFLGS